MWAIRFSNCCKAFWWCWKILKSWSTLYKLLACLTSHIYILACLTKSSLHRAAEKSHSPSKISWRSPPWRVSCEGPAASPAGVRKSFLKQLVAASSPFPACRTCRTANVTAVPPTSHCLPWQPTSYFQLWSSCHTHSHYTVHLPASACKQKQPQSLRLQTLLRGTNINRP